MSYRASTATLVVRTEPATTKELTMDQIGFLVVPEATAEVQRMFEEDTAELRHVVDVSRLWACQPATVTGLFTLLRQVNSGDRLGLRRRSIPVTACTSAFGDSYCALGWESTLAKASEAQTAAWVLDGADLGTSERAIAGWARTLARHRSGAPAMVRDVLTFGRPIEDVA
jgi:hypothetical protein